MDRKSSSPWKATGIAGFTLRWANRAGGVQGEWPSRAVGELDVRIHPWMHGCVGKAMMDDGQGASLGLDFRGGQTKRGGERGEGRGATRVGSGPLPSGMGQWNGLIDMTNGHVIEKDGPLHPVHQLHFTPLHVESSESERAVHVRSKDKVGRHS